MYTRTPSATGVAVASRTVLSVTWPAASTVPVPGGSPGPTTNTMIGVTITDATSQSSAMFRKWGLSSMLDRPGTVSDDLEVAAHVPDRLHRPPVPLDESGGAWHEALPAVQPLRGRAERERDGHMRVAQRAGRVGAQVLGVGVGTRERDGQADLGNREGMGWGRGVDHRGRLTVEEHRSHGPGGLREIRVAQPGGGVVLVDREVHEGVSGHLEGRVMTPVRRAGVHDVVGHPGAVRVAQLGRGDGREVHPRAAG